MDPNKPMYIDTNTTTLSEALSVLHDTPEIRPYQAYCDTEISSCPPSPENLAPSPLRVRKVYLKQIDMSAQASIVDASEQVSLTRVVTSSSDKQVDLPRPVPPENNTREQDQGMSQRSFLGSVTSVTPDHTTQPINPRGSHSLGDHEVTAYDFDPAITRVEPLKHTDGVTGRTIPGKPVPEYRGALGTIYRPLPQVSLEKIKLESHDRPKPIYEHGCVQYPPQTMDPEDKILEERDGETSLRCCQGVDDVQPMPSPDPPSYDEFSAAILRLLPGDLLLSAPTSPSYNSRVRNCRRTAQAEFGDTHTRRFLSTEPGNSQRNAHDIDEATAGIPDQFEEIDPEPPNAQLPPRSPETTFQRRFHQDGIAPLRQDRTHPRLYPAPSFYSSIYLQNGPRPPPLGFLRQPRPAAPPTQ